MDVGSANEIVLSQNVQSQRLRFDKDIKWICVGFDIRQGCLLRHISRRQRIERDIVNSVA